jgi:hypothetical protein
MLFTSLGHFIIIIIIDAYIWQCPFILPGWLSWMESRAVKIDFDHSSNAPQPHTLPKA